MPVHQNRDGSYGRNVSGGPQWFRTAHSSVHDNKCLGSNRCLDTEAPMERCGWNAERASVSEFSKDNGRIDKAGRLTPRTVGIAYGRFGWRVVDSEPQRTAFLRLERFNRCECQIVRDKFLEVEEDRIGSRWIATANILRAARKEWRIVLGDADRCVSLVWWTARVATQGV